jgi:hypothetical protein
MALCVQLTFTELHTSGNGIQWWVKESQAPDLQMIDLLTQRHNKILTKCKIQPKDELKKSLTMFYGLILDRNLTKTWKRFSWGNDFTEISRKDIISISATFSKQNKEHVLMSCDSLQLLHTGSVNASN